MPCKASQHSCDSRFLVREFQMQAVAVLWYMDSTCTLLLLCAEFGPLPQPDQASADWIFLHTGSLTVSQPALKGLAPRVTQFDSFSLSHRPSPRQVLHEWGQRKLQIYWSRVPWCTAIEELANPLATPCQEGTLRGQRIWGHCPAYLGDRQWAKRPHFTCLERLESDPAGEAVKNNFNASCGLEPLSWVRGRFFLECHELSLVP